MSAAIERFEPRQTKVTARLSEQGAMLEELRTVIPTLQPERARADVRKAILEDNVLRRPSIASRKKVFKKLSARYFRADTPQATARLVAALQRESDPIQVGLYAYTMLLWNDALIFHLGCDWLAPKLGRAPFEVEASDVEDELKRLSKRFPEIKKWSQSTRQKVSTHYLSLLRDCGFATGAVRKHLRRPYISPEVVLFGAQLVTGGGEPPANILEHPLFTAMGLSVEDVISALTELQQHGHIEFAIQGGAVYFKEELEKKSAYECKL